MRGSRTFNLRGRNKAPPAKGQRGSPGFACGVCVCLEGNIPVTVCYRCAAYCCIVLLVPLCCVY